MHVSSESASVTSKVPPLLPLPDELLTQICEHLLNETSYQAHDKAWASLTTVCKRTHRVAIPIRWKIVKLGNQPINFAVQVAGLAIYGHHVESISASLFLADIPCDLIDELAGNLRYCSHLSAVSLDGFETDGSGLPLVHRLVPILTAGQFRLRRLEILLSFSVDIPFIDEFAPLLRHSPHLEVLEFGTLLYRPRGRRAPQVTTFAFLRELSIPDMRFLSPSARLPMLRRVAIGEVSPTDLPLMETCFGPSLESLSVTMTWAQPPTGLQVSFPRVCHLDLSSTLMALKPPVNLLTNVLHPSTPLKTLAFTALDDEIVFDLQRFVARRSRITLKRIISAKEAFQEVQNLQNRLLGDSSVNSERDEQVLQDELENRARPRYRRFCARAEQRGIEVVLLWLSRADDGCVVA